MITDIGRQLLISFITAAVQSTVGRIEMLGTIYRTYNAAIIGVLVYAVWFAISNGIESTYFWSIVDQVREATGEIDSFAVGERVVRYPKVIVMILSATALRFGIPMFIAARIAKSNPLKQCAALFFFMLFTTFLLTEGWLKRPLLSLAELLVIATASSSAYLLGHHKSIERPTSSCNGRAAPAGEP